jgi:hypothetical protein
MEFTNQTAQLSNASPTGKPVPPPPLAILEAIGEAWLDSHSCQGWLLQQLHPTGPHCRWCGQAFASPAQVVTWQAGGRLHCQACSRWCTPTTNTGLHKSGLTPRRYVLLCLLALAGLDDRAIAQRLEVHPETVRRWRHRWQEAA